MGNSDDGYHDIRFNQDVQDRLLISSIILYIGVCANVAVFIHLIKNWRVHNRVHFFVMCLCLADFFGLAARLGTDIGWSATIAWKANTGICKMAMFLHMLGSTVSHYVLASFSTDSLVTITSLKSTKMVRVILAIISVFVGIAACVPKAVMYKVYTYPNNINFKQCAMFLFFESRYSETVYFLVDQAVLFWLPLTIIVSTGVPAYIAWRVKRDGDSELARVRKHDRDGANLHAYGLDIAMVLVYDMIFILCWLPICSLDMYTRVGTSVMYGRLRTLWFAFNYLSVVSSCLNPLVYGAFIRLRLAREPRSGLELKPRARHADNQG